MEKFIIVEDDFVFTYKEQYFTGFAPCFEQNIYSLACCKGNKKHGGMRARICKLIESLKNNNSIWVVSIAGCDISKGEHNNSKVEYAPGDIIYMARISKESKSFSWSEYMQEYKRRSDAIYELKNGRIVPIKNRKCKKCKQKIHDENNIASDCATEMGGSETEIYTKFKQIITTEEFYIFNKGLKCEGVLSVGRNYAYKDKGYAGERVASLKKLLEKPHEIKYKSKNPFEKC